ncbi:MAG: hypothetical protein E7357_00345 [Clostridiales bacterium]|nr:hypothetical protein [Clostridiales bacterium]
MNYVKKMCILRQIKQGFSGDGKTLSGLVKAEQYGKNLAVEVSVINFAPLIVGEYFCLLSDGKGKTETLALRGKSLFNLLSDIDISNGFCAVVCYVKNEVVPIAYGINGNGAYDFKRILNATLPPVFPQNQPDFTAENAETEPAVIEEEPPKTQDGYDDETVATENYYSEKENEQEQLSQVSSNAPIESGAENQNAEERLDAPQNDHAEKLLHPFATDTDGYYLSVKSEWDELVKTYPRDKTLNGAFSCSEWVRVKGDEQAPQYLVGVIYEEGKARYICYALAAKDKNAPPEEIKDVCTFVPCSVFSETDGFFIIFQSAATGECIRPDLV